MKAIETDADLQKFLEENCRCVYYGIDQLYLDCDIFVCDGKIIAESDEQQMTFGLDEMDRFVEWLRGLESELTIEDVASTIEQELQYAVECIQDQVGYFGVREFARDVVDAEMPADERVEYLTVMHERAENIRNQINTLQDALQAGMKRLQNEVLLLNKESQ